MEVSQSLLDYIVQPKNTSHVCEKWANGAKGIIADYKGLCRYRFYRSFYNEDGKMIGHEMVMTNAPIVAEGLVAYWLHYRKNNNPCTKIPDEKQKSITDIFNDYTDDRLNAYKGEKEQDPSSWRCDLEREFYTRHIIPSEKHLIKQSEALFEYITTEDQHIVRKVTNEYLCFLKDKCNSYQCDDDRKRKVKQQSSRQVDEEQLKKHFTREFNNKDFYSTFFILLEESQSDKQLARVAFLIYDSKYFIKSDYPVFSKWYADFCKIVGCEYHPDYAPSALKDEKLKELQDKYYFLH